MNHVEACCSIGNVIGNKWLVTSDLSFWDVLLVPVHVLTVASIFLRRSPGLKHAKVQEQHVNTVMCLLIREKC